MADIAELYGTDLKLEVEGQWVKYPGFTLCIARFGNPHYKEYWDRITKPHQTEIRQDVLSQEVSEELMIDAMANTILLDWDGIEEKGKTLPYSVEAAKRLLAIKDFRGIVFEAANMAETFRQVELKESAKNSKRSSTGKSSGDQDSTSSVSD